MKILKSKFEKGITLVALVITIIILIILAGVSINLVFNQNGIIQKAKQAKEDYTNAAENEREQIDKMINEIEIAIGDNIEDTVLAESIGFTPTDPNWKVTNVKEALDYLYNN